MLIVDNIAYVFLGVAAFVVIVWALVMTHEMMKSDLGRGVLVMISAWLFVLGVIGSIIWLVGRKLI
jgi:hypothetical protein